MDRKEAKDHGEGGVLVGAAVKKSGLLMTWLPQVQRFVNDFEKRWRNYRWRFGGTKERGQGELSAIQEVQKELLCTHWLPWKI